METKNLEIQATNIFQQNWKALDSEYRIIINEGGTGSSKTYSLAQLFILLLITQKGQQLTIARKTFPALRATAMKDFFIILKQMNYYREEWHNKSENTYRFPPTNSEVDFISIDEPIKVRSRRRDYLWMNEANEFTYDDFEQLNMRTTKKIFLDYNPSFQTHWIYDKLQTREDCIIIPSTYKDNPFLPEELVKEIESYKNKDQNYWRIYGLGLRGISETLVYTHWKYCDELPENYDKKIFGLDFGYNNPTALIEIREKDQAYYWQERLYERYLTNQDLIERLKSFVKDGILSYNDTIYGDSAEPARINEIKQSGFNILPCVKLEVKDGIDFIKSKDFYITKNSVNLLKEIQTYNWKTKEDKLLDEPVKVNDHLLDAGRYAIISEAKGLTAQHWKGQEMSEADKTMLGDLLKKPF